MTECGAALQGRRSILEKMFRLRERIVDPSLNRVFARGQTVQVEPKIMQVLVALAERPGEVVTREELMARVWAGVFVTDDVLNRAVRELRRLFDDGTNEPGVIETIRKRGYRLTTPVEQVVEQIENGVRSRLGNHTAASDRGGRPTHARRFKPAAATLAAMMVVAVAALVLVVRYGAGRPASVDTKRGCASSRSRASRATRSIRRCRRRAARLRCPRGGRTRAPLHEDVGGCALGAGQRRRRA